MLKLWQEFLDRPDDRDIWGIHFKMAWYVKYLNTKQYSIYYYYYFITILYQLCFAVFKIRIIKRSVWLLLIYNSVFIFKSAPSRTSVPKSLK